MKPHYEDAWLQVFQGDAMTVLREMPAESVHMVMTSPPYWGLRSYGSPPQVFGGDPTHIHEWQTSRKTTEIGGGNWAQGTNGRGEPQPGGADAKREPIREEMETGHCICGAWLGHLGQEPTPEQYVANMVGVFREVRRVLRADGVVFLNMGDSYAAQRGGTGMPAETLAGGVSGKGDEKAHRGRGLGTLGGRQDNSSPQFRTGPVAHRNAARFGLKHKDLIGMPWRLAFALQQPYYTGSIKDEKHRIWLAAMVEAEGCLFLHRRRAGQSNGQGYFRKNDSYGAGLEVANTSRAIVERCMAIIGKGSISEQTPDQNQRRKQTIYRWSMRSNECREVIRELYPYFVAKQHQARLLLGCPPSGSDAEKAHASLIALHRGGEASIDFPAPEPMFERGWFLRSDIVWAKCRPNPMPESVTDRPTKAHEYLFLLSKAARYFYDAEAVREAAIHEGVIVKASNPATAKNNQKGQYGATAAGFTQHDTVVSGRNLRSVWSIATEPWPGAHYATFPRKLVEPCIKAGTSERGVCPECGAPWMRIVERGRTLDHDTYRDGKTMDGPYAKQAAIRSGILPTTKTTGWRPSCAHDAEPSPAVCLDPFAGTGTVGLVAQSLSRRAVLIDLNAEYLEQCLQRNQQTPLGLVP